MDLLRGQNRRKGLLEDFKRDKGEAFHGDRILVAPSTKVEYVNYNEDGVAAVVTKNLPPGGLVIEQGQVLSVHTPRLNAAGKQTFLKSLARILLPVDGFIYYPANLRVRFISPEPQLITGSVARNLKFGNQHPHSGADIRAACKLFRLSEDLWNDVHEEKEPAHGHGGHEEHEGHGGHGHEEHGHGPKEVWGLRPVGLNGEKLALSERIRIVLIRAMLSSVDMLLLHNVLDPLGPADADHVIGLLKDFVKDRGLKCLPQDMTQAHHLRKQKTVVISTKSPHIESVVHNTLVLNMQ